MQMLVQAGATRPIAGLARLRQHAPGPIHAVQTMRFLTRHAPTLVALLLVSSAQAAEPRREPLEGWADIDAEGRVQAVQWGKRVPRWLHGPGLQALRAVEFAAARDGDLAAASRTWLSGSFVLTPEGEDFAIGMEKVSAGPGVIRLRPPRHPGPAAGVLTPRSAAFLARFEVGPDGRALAVETSATARERAFAAAVQDVLAEWQFEPEQIGGVAVASSMCIPFVFGERGSEEALRREAERFCRSDRRGPVAQTQQPAWHTIGVYARAP